MAWGLSGTSFPVDDLRQVSSLTFTSERSNPFAMSSILSTRIRLIALSALITLSASVAFADGLKIGYTNLERVFREAPAAILSGKKIEAEFSQRDKEIQRLAAELKTKQNSLAENGLALSDPQRRVKEAEINDLNLALQRRQREFKDDLQVWQAEANSAIIEKANAAVKRVAESENLDMVLQDVVWASKSIDITDQVLKILGDDK